MVTTIDRDPNMSGSMTLAGLNLAFLLWALVPTVVRADDRTDPELDATLNGALFLLEADFGVSRVDTYTTLETVGTTIFFNDRSKQWAEHFVPFDDRRTTSREITWTVDTTEGATTSGLTAEATSGAIRRAMTTWNDVKSTNLPLVDGGDVPADLGVVQFILTGGAQGLPFPVADIMHAGFLPGGFFDALEPGGGDYILGVTFSFVFLDDNGEFTDINGDGKLDVAFREIYYNDSFLWGVDATTYPVYDVQTVALHEAGHGLSQDHFGKAFLTNKNGKIHFAPRAVMNAAYSGLQHNLTGTDLGGHSSIWASWPN